MIDQNSLPPPPLSLHSFIQSKGLTLGEVYRVLSPCPSLPVSPDPNDQTVEPSSERAKVCEQPQETCLTAPMVVTLVGVFIVVVLP